MKNGYFLKRRARFVAPKATKRAAHSGRFVNSFTDKKYKKFIKLDTIRDLPMDSDETWKKESG